MDFDPDQVLAIAGWQLMASADAGETWRMLGPFDDGLTFIAFDTKIQDSIYVAMSSGMLKSVTGIP